MPFAPLAVNFEDVDRPPGMAQVVHNLGESFVPMPRCVLLRPVSVLMECGQTLERHGKISVPLVVPDRIEGVDLAVRQAVPGFVSDGALLDMINPKGTKTNRYM